MRMLVVGVSGQLGAKLAGLAKGDGHQVSGTYKSRPPMGRMDDSYQLDKTSQTQVEELIQKLKPEVVVDTGALHNVDYCESHPREAMVVNSDGTQYLAGECKNAGAKFIFVSTDYVFDGLEAPYAEDSEPAPLNAYGRSKLEGERTTLESSPRNIVVRPSVIYSWVATDDMRESSSGKSLNFGGWLISQLASQHELGIVDDQISSPTIADDLARAILSLAASSSGGIFHAAGATALSRYEFAVKVAMKMGLRSELIHPVKSTELKQLAKRPVNSSLSSNRIRKEVGYRMMAIDEALELFASQAESRVVA